ncbi:hypothetical protein D9758_011406 [Tetrapyrgos nigripes]|uniref:Uncharacterized protein n=1 Tax=Tetrapyrgos nigripes TaxID=182062 RepID=A0A8H5FQH7_9AGAR|nr:hypothetical protein D9758_011406 [Tetrapyrgos nigripes]
MCYDEDTQDNQDMKQDSLPAFTISVTQIAHASQKRPFPAAYNCPCKLQRVDALGDGDNGSFLRRRETLLISTMNNHESKSIWGISGPQIPASLSHRVHFFLHSSVVHQWTAISILVEFGGG